MNSELITKKIYEEHQDEFLEGCSSIEELSEMYGVDKIANVFCLILNPDHNNYDSLLTNLELDDNNPMTSCGYTNTNAGFIDNGEVARIGIFSLTKSIDELKNKLSDVLLGIHQIK